MKHILLECASLSAACALLIIPSTSPSFVVSRSVHGLTFSAARAKPAATLAYGTDRTHVVLRISNLFRISNIGYELTYDTGSTTQGAQGSADVSGSSSYERTIYLGTCSEGGTCTPHTDATDITVHVTLTDIDGNHTVLESGL